MCPPSGLAVSRRDLLRLGGTVGLTAFAAACGVGTSGADTATARAVTSSAPLAPFVPSTGTPVTTGLPRRVAWAATADNGLFVDLATGLREAAGARGIDYVTADAGGDPATNVAQIRSLLARGVGSLVLQPLDQSAQQPLMRQAIASGAAVQGIITWPTTMQVVADQYAFGYQQGLAAAAWIDEHLGGSATVCELSQSGLSPQLDLNYEGIADGVRTAKGTVRIVRNPNAATDATVSDGYSAMLTLIQQHPDITVVVGFDVLAVGAYRALQSLGKLTPEMYVSGGGGAAEAVALVKEGGPFRADLVYSWRTMGFALGQFAADWIEGRSIPRVLQVKGIPLDSAASVDAFDADESDVAAVWADPARRATYVNLSGTTSYAERGTVWQGAYEPGRSS